MGKEAREIHEKSRSSSAESFFVRSSGSQRRGVTSTTVTVSTESSLPSVLLTGQPSHSPEQSTDSRFIRIRSPEQSTSRFIRIQSPGQSIQTQVPVHVSPVASNHGSHVRSPPLTSTLTEGIVVKLPP